MQEMHCVVSNDLTLRPAPRGNLRHDMHACMLEKELGERNFSFDSLKTRLKHMAEKGIAVADSRTPVELRSGRSRRSDAGGTELRGRESGRSFGIRKRQQSLSPPCHG